MTTLEDIAKAAHVSKMTVSRAINHPEQVRDELKINIFKVMHQLDYRPNVAAKALVRNRTQIIKFFILEDIDITEPYYMKLMVGLAERLAKQQYSLQLMTDRHLDIGGSDGYLITGMRAKDHEWLSRLELPFVTFGENRWRFNFVDTNNELGTQMATQYAFSRHYEHIIFIGMAVQEPYELSREKGYTHVMQAQGMVPEIKRFNNHSRIAMHYIQTQLATIPANTCFVCASDRLAFGVEKGILEVTGSVGNNYGVIGFDGVFLDQVATPKLTTIEQPMLDLGTRCADMLLAKINHPEQSLEDCLLKPRLKLGGSTR
ncbi:LacI family DNA-binding transcriptional regulator [Agrilactobacillus fermenti]|uniref:LacI family DNA-binding transcriptional regulator n=1 Tax=Agrilactobacillus fermenti TaxID=2586909 RepID=UPI003A5C003C